MPIQHDDAREITRRLSRGQEVERLTERLAPTSAETRPIPPSVPAPREWSADAVRALRRCQSDACGVLPSRSPPFPASHSAACRSSRVAVMMSSPFSSTNLVMRGQDVNK